MSRTLFGQRPYCLFLQRGEKFLILALKPHVFDHWVYASVPVTSLTVWVLQLDGTPTKVYHKAHLVPLPFTPTHLFASEFSCCFYKRLHTGKGPKTMAHNSCHLLHPHLFCTPSVALQNPHNRPEWLPELTNDAWFLTVALDQHLPMFMDY